MRCRRLQKPRHLCNASFVMVQGCYKGTFPLPRGNNVFCQIVEVVLSFATWAKYNQADVEVMLLLSCGQNIARQLKKLCFFNQMANVPHIL